MHRRQFLATSLASSALAFCSTVIAQPLEEKKREFYQLRKYTMQTGPQTGLAEKYFADAFIPALKRLGFGPIGAFKLDIGPETPTYYLLLPGNDARALTMVDFALAADSVFLEAAKPFWNSPAIAPAFLRVENSLHVAFEGWPKLTLPAAKGKRMFQMRTYESPSYDDHIRKVEMFNIAEMEIFRNAGFHPVFFGDTLLGPRIPSLTYMLSFTDVDQLNAQWEVFKNDPAWKKLQTNPRYGFEAIVSNISNLYLSPLHMSEI